MRTTGFVVLACLALAGCGSPEDVLAMAAVRDELRDPTDAIFRNVEEAPGGVCGEVNGKNAYGGRSGFQRFLVLADGSVVLEERHSAAFLDELDALAGCKR